jgi:hypothetical protein
VFTRKRLFAVASVVSALAVAAPVAHADAAPVPTTAAIVNDGGGYGGYGHGHYNPWYHGYGHHGYGNWSNNDDD